MKKKVLNSLGMVAIIAILTINITAVLDDNATTHLKWEFVGKVLADTISSGSSSGGVAGDGIKNVVTKDCTCANGKDGHTLKCEDVNTTGEECTTDPLTKCYKLTVTLKPLGANAVICD